MVLHIFCFYYVLFAVYGTKLLRDIYLSPNGRIGTNSERRFIANFKEL